MLANTPMMRYVISMCVNFGCTPTLRRINTSFDSVGGQRMIDSGAHVVFHILVTKRKTTKCSLDRSAFNGTAVGVRHYGTLGRTIAPIIGYQMAVHVGSSSAPGLSISHISTCLVNNATVDEGKYAVLVLAMKFRCHAEAVLIGFDQTFMVSTS